MENQTYEMKLVCCNCFQKFFKTFKKGFETKESGCLSDKIIRDENGELVECPNCGCTGLRKAFPMN